MELSQFHCSIIKYHFLSQSLSNASHSLLCLTEFTELYPSNEYSVTYDEKDFEKSSINEKRGLIVM